MSIDGLGCHPVRRAAGRKGLLVLVDINCDSEIRDFDFALLGEQDIESFDVSVYNIELVQVFQPFQYLVDVEFDQSLGEDGDFAELAQGAAFQVLEDKVYLVVFHDCVFVAHDVFMIETFQDVDFFFDGLDELFADGYFLHGHEDAVVEVDSLVDFAVGALSDLFDQLVTLNDPAFRNIIHH